MVVKATQMLLTLSKKEITCVKLSDTCLAVFLHIAKNDFYINDFLI